VYGRYRSRPRQLCITKCVVPGHLVERQLCGQLSLFITRDVHYIYFCLIKVIKTPSLYLMNSSHIANIGPSFFFLAHSSFLRKEALGLCERRAVCVCACFLSHLNHLDWRLPNCATRIPRDPRPSSQGIHGYSPVMAALKFTYFLIERNNVLLKIISERLYS
jgi:hypothetical protein